LYGNGLRSKGSLFEVVVGLNTTGDGVRSQGVVHRCTQGGERGEGGHLMYPL
jgi:hypothetical protein